MSKFRLMDRNSGSLLPPSVDDWLPQGHVARIVVDVVDGLDVSTFTKSDRGGSAAAFHPSLLLALLVYGYISGVFSSRKLERATYESIAFRFIAANKHPDHATIAAFRRRYTKEIEGHFVQVLLLARELGMAKLGRVALDGTKSHASASPHSSLAYEQSALSYEDNTLTHEHAAKIEAQLKAQVADLLDRAEAADESDAPDGMSMPDDLARNKDRLGKIAEARTKIEARTKASLAHQKATGEAKATARAADAKPARPTEHSAPASEEPRTTPATTTNVVVATHDQRQMKPVAKKLDAYTEDLGKSESTPPAPTPSQAPSPLAAELAKKDLGPPKNGIFELLAGFGKMLMGGKEKKPPEAKPTFDTASPALIVRKQELSVEFFRKKNEMIKAQGTNRYNALKLELEKIQAKQKEVDAELDSLIEKKTKFNQMSV